MPRSIRSEKPLKITRSSGNVFRDLGFSAPKAEQLFVRSDLTIHIGKVLAARKLKQKEAAKILGVAQRRLADLRRGRIDRFTTDALIGMLARLGISVRLVFRPLRPRTKIA